MENRLKYNLSTLLLLFPWIAVLAVFWTYPLIYSGYLSLTEYKTLTNETTFIGFDNYIKAFHDEVFWIALKNTTYFVLITVPVTLTIALILAEIINQKVKYLNAFWQASYFLPSVTSMVVVALIFTNLYSQNGYINNLLQLLGLPYSKEGFLLNQSTAMNAIIAMDVWLSIGYYMVLFLAGLQTIPKELYESAKLAGANFWQTMLNISLPGIRSTIVFVLLIDLIKSFQIFIEIFVMTKGGPLYSTTTMVYYVFDQAFIKADAMGYASAIAYILFFFLLFLSLIQIKIGKKND